MKQKYLKFKESTVSYLEFGQGTRLMIALHGFGDRATLFEALIPSLGLKYTVLALDLPYHGKTVWKAPTFDREDLNQLFIKLLDLYEQDHFSLLGYSLGGRLSQVLLPYFVDRLDHLYLVAPDGIRTKWMFNVTLMPKWFRQIVKRLVDRPDWVFRLLRVLHQKKLITKFVHDFAYNHLKTPERRQRIFCTWISITYFANRPAKIKKLLASSALSTDLFFGKRDEVIPLSGGKWLSKGLSNVRLHVLNEGHLLIDQELNDLLDNLLNDKSKERNELQRSH